jgi:hypothetical protein
MDVDAPFAAGTPAAAAGAGAPVALAAAERLLAAERRRWEEQAAQILAYCEDAFHWRECNDGYERAIEAYYRFKHEHERTVIRLNAEAAFAGLSGGIAGAAPRPAAPARAQAPSPMAASPMATSPTARSPLAVRPAAQNRACGAAAAARGKRRMGTASPIVPLKRAHF